MFLQKKKKKFTNNIAFSKTTHKTTTCGGLWYKKRIDQEDKETKLQPN